MKSWWEETELKAHRAKSPAGLGQALFQRLVSAGIDADRAAVPAYDLGVLHGLCADYVKLVESVLLMADGDHAGLRRQALLLDRWAQQAEFWVASSAAGFNLLLDSLELDSELLGAREELEVTEVVEAPEAESKLDGRYRNWHLLYERLDLKLASVELGASVHRPLARVLARIYEESLVTLRVLEGLEKEARPRFGAMARLLLDINTTWHFDIGVHHLGGVGLKLRPNPAKGLRYWLMTAWG